MEKGFEMVVSDYRPSPSLVLLDEKKAALFLGVSPRTLQSWRVRGGRGPTYRKIGSLVRYLEADLISFVEAQARHSTSEN